VLLNHHVDCLLSIIEVEPIVVSLTAMLARRSCVLTLRKVLIFFLHILSVLAIKNDFLDLILGFHRTFEIRIIFHRQKCDHLLIEIAVVLVCLH